MTLRVLAAISCGLLMMISVASADVLEIHAPGLIKDNLGGAGVSTRTVYAPDMGPAFIGVPTTLRSQISEPGGYRVGGDQCSARNFVQSSGRPFRWWDTYCEARSGVRSSLCQRKPVHQGLDMVGGTRASCLENLADDRRGGLAGIDNVPIYAVSDGQVNYFGKSYSLNLNAVEGVYKYLHINMSKILVPHGAQVNKGDKLGYMSRDFGVNRTTYHLHLELWKELDGIFVPVPLYFTYAVAQAKYEERDIKIFETGEVIPVADIGGDEVRVESESDASSMIASFWSTGEEEYGLVASGIRRVFISHDENGDPIVRYDGVLIEDDNGNLFYDGFLKLFNADCGTASVPYGGPVTQGALAVNLVGHNPVYDANCAIDSWNAEAVGFSFVQRNAEFQAETVDLEKFGL